MQKKNRNTSVSSFRSTAPPGCHVLRWMRLPVPQSRDCFLQGVIKCGTMEPLFRVQLWGLTLIRGPPFLKWVSEFWEQFGSDYDWQCAVGLMSFVPVLHGWLTRCLTVMGNWMHNCNLNSKPFLIEKNLKALNLPMRAELPGLMVIFVPEGDVSTERVLVPALESTAVKSSR